MLIQYDSDGNWISNYKVENPCRSLNVNGDSKNVYLIDYWGGSGGNFIINCLQLSSLYSHLSKEQKINCIKNGLESSISNNVWMDFRIFEFSESDYHNHNYIFLGCHHVMDRSLQTKKLLKIFKYSKVIQIINPTLFTSLRGFRTETYVSIKQFLSLNNDEKRNVASKIKKLPCYEGNYNERLFYSWDATWYLSEKLTLDNIEKLYKKLSFPDFDKDLVKWYYRNWIDTMDRLWYL